MGQSGGPISEGFPMMMLAWLKKAAVLCSVSEDVDDLRLVDFFSPFDPERWNSRRNKFFQGFFLFYFGE